MSRPYETIPRQGKHRKASTGEEPTTSVRAQQPAHPTTRSKATRLVHVLSVNRRAGLYRLQMKPPEAVFLDEGFEEVSRVPAGGDLNGLAERLPESSRHAVAENSSSGSRHLARGFRISDTWTAGGSYDRITFFDDAERAASFAREGNHSAS